MDDATERLAELFHQALEHPPAERSNFLDRVAAGDGELRRQLESLLDAHKSSTGFFEGLAADVVAPGYAAIVERGARSAATELRRELEDALQGRYRIEEELGGGGMSRVFRAEEIGLGRQVVIKVLPPELAATMSGERFRREIQLAAQLQHPHIVPLLTSDAGGRLVYYTMPFVSGESLRNRLARENSLPLKDALTIWRDVLEALAHAHARKVVHRDIKPGNILLGDRSAMVTDFGIARAIEAAAGDPDATAPGVVIGTPAYMAPEQADPAYLPDARSDIYSAGLVMYEMLQGRRSDADPLTITRSDCPPELAALVLQCLARKPEDRPATAEVLLTELESLAGGAAAMRRSRLPRTLTVVGIAVLMAIVVVVLWRSRSPVAESVASTPSVAVLPLASHDSGTAALAGGITEELMAGLGRVGRVRVIGSTSIQSLQARNLDVRQIAESLKVTHYLEGSLQRDGVRLRVQVRLVNARDGATRWSQTYDKTVGDIFAVQEDIARAVALELDLRLSPPDAGTRAIPSPLNHAAWEFYLRGRDPTLIRSTDGRRQGIGYLSRAIQADSMFAAAYAGLGWLYLNEAGSLPADHREWHRRAEAVARRALALDSTLAEGYSLLGWAQAALGNLEAGEASLDRAIALDPTVHRGYEGLARIYMRTGQHHAQLAAARQGLEYDPYSTQAAREMALALNANGRCNETLELLRPLKDLDPPARVAGVIRGICFAKQERWTEAIAELRWAGQGDGARAALAFLGYALARGGQPAEARRILDDLKSGRRLSHGAFGIAVVSAGLRDFDQAFLWLERAMEEGSARIYAWDPLFEELHRDPRFQRIRALAGAQNR